MLKEYYNADGNICRELTIDTKDGNVPFDKLTFKAVRLTDLNNPSLIVILVHVSSTHINGASSTINETFSINLNNGGLFGTDNIHGVMSILNYIRLVNSKVESNHIHLCCTYLISLIDFTNHSETHYFKFNKFSKDVVAYVDTHSKIGGIIYKVDNQYQCIFHLDTQHIVKNIIGPAITGVNNHPLSISGLSIDIKHDKAIDVQVTIISKHHSSPLVVSLEVTNDDIPERLKYIKNDMVFRKDMTKPIEDVDVKCIDVYLGYVCSILSGLNAGGMAIKDWGEERDSLVMSISNISVQPVEGNPITGFQEWINIYRHRALTHNTIINSVLDKFILPKLPDHEPFKDMVEDEYKLTIYGEIPDIILNIISKDFPVKYDGDIKTRIILPLSIIEEAGIKLSDLIKECDFKVKRVKNKDKRRYKNGGK